MESNSKVPNFSYFYFYIVLEIIVRKSENEQRPNSENKCVQIVLLYK